MDSNIVRVLTLDLALQVVDTTRKIYLNKRGKSVIEYLGDEYEIRPERVFLSERTSLLGRLCYWRNKIVPTVLLDPLEIGDRDILTRRLS